jgi:hypothetical protein
MYPASFYTLEGMENDSEMKIHKQGSSFPWRWVFVMIILWVVRN